jgi:hypothetical protein
MQDYIGLQAMMLSWKPVSSKQCFKAADTASCQSIWENIQTWTGTLENRYLDIALETGTSIAQQASQLHHHPNLAAHVQLRCAAWESTRQTVCSVERRSPARARLCVSACLSRVVRRPLRGESHGTPLLLYKSLPLRREHAIGCSAIVKVACRVSCRRSRFVARVL